MIGPLVNALAIVVGGFLGMLFKKGIPEKLSETLMKGLGLCTLFIGISGSLKGENTLILIISMVIGIVIGELIGLEEKINRLGEWVEKKVKTEKKEGQTKVSVAEGFVTSSLLFCVGAMAIMGSMSSGIQGDHSILFNKSILDLVAAVIFASSLGIGVVLSSVLLFTYEGTLTLLSSLLVPFLTETVIHEMTCVGSVILIGLGLNMLGITKIRVMNLVPAMFLPILLCLFM